MRKGDIRSHTHYVFSFNFLYFSFLLVWQNNDLWFLKYVEMIHHFSEMHWHKKGELLPKKVLATSSSGVISAVALKYQKNILYICIDQYQNLFFFKYHWRWDDIIDSLCLKYRINDKINSIKKLQCVIRLTLIWRLWGYLSNLW